MCMELVVVVDVTVAFVKEKAWQVSPSTRAKVTIIIALCIADPGNKKDMMKAFGVMMVPNNRQDGKKDKVKFAFP